MNMKPLQEFVGRHFKEPLETRQRRSAFNSAEKTCEQIDLAHRPELVEDTREETLTTGKIIRSPWSVTSGGNQIALRQRFRHGKPTKVESYQLYVAPKAAGEDPDAMASIYAEIVIGGEVIKYSDENLAGTDYAAADTEVLEMLASIRDRLAPSPTTAAS